MADWIAQAIGKTRLPTCCICGCMVDGRRDEFGAAKRSGSKAVFWHDRCYRKRYGKTSEQYSEMKRAELQTELSDEDKLKLKAMKGAKMGKTNPVWVIAMEGGKVWRELKDGYPTEDAGLFVCKTSKNCWKVIDEGTGLHIGNGFKTKREAVASLDDEMLAKVAKYRESHRYRGAVRANELVWAHGSMPKAEYLKRREELSEEELEMFKQKMEREAKAKAGADVEVKVGESGGVTAIEMTPKRFKRAEPSPEPKIETEIKSLKGEVVCITGTLNGMTRSEASTRLKLAGGIPSANFTKHVTMLVVAENAGKSKRDRAERAIANGQEVKVVSGTAFLKALARKPMAPKPPVKKQEATEKKEENVDKRIEELEAKLKAMSEELEQVWKENAKLKAKTKPATEKETEVATEHATEVSLKAMQEWCEGKGLVATQKHEKTCIWVEGESTPYKDELVEMGFRFAKKRKSWYFDPKRAA